MLRFDRLTVKAQEALQEAQGIAARHNHQQIEPLHLLSALATQTDGVVPPLLSRLGVRPEAFLSELDRRMEQFSQVTGITQQHLGSATNAVLEQAFDEAERFKDEYVSTEHLLLAIAALPSDPAAELLKKHGASHDAVLQALTSIRGSHRVTSANPEATYRALEQYAALRRARAALVIGDHPDRPFHAHELTAGWTFVRFHYGSRGRGGNYSDAEIDTWSRRIAQWRRKVDVYAYFNNDRHAYAVRNARRLQRALS